jgi:hypothetical protein
MEKAGKAVLFVPLGVLSSRIEADQIRSALELNACHSWLSRIVLIADDQVAPALQAAGDQVLVHRLGRKPSFADWIELSLHYALEADLSICAHLPIELDAHFLAQALREIQTHQTLLCISAHHAKCPDALVLRDRPERSQDAWALTPEAVREVAQSFGPALRIDLGMSGSGNRLAYEFWLRSWCLINPCQRVFAWDHEDERPPEAAFNDVRMLGGAAFVNPSSSLAVASMVDIIILSLNQSAPYSLRHESVALGEQLPLGDSLELQERGELWRAESSRVNLEGGKLVLRSSIDMGEWDEIHHYTDRFKVYGKDSLLAFVDLEWPSLLICADPGFAGFRSGEMMEAFFWGFCPPVTEFIPDHISDEKLFPGHLNFWQYPCRTEQDAFARHQRIDAPAFGSRVVHTYLGLPWATWIDSKQFPVQLLKAFGDRFRSVRAYLADSGFDFQVHTVCQHIDWKLSKCIKHFERADVNQLWIAHKHKGWDREGQLHLRAWPLFAVNLLDSARCEGLEVWPMEQKRVFASFKGAHMENYMSDIRLRLRDLACLEGYEIEVTDLWHFHEFVFDYQIGGLEEKREVAKHRDIVEYNELLTQTQFSLCPAGSGPNTLRLWESLGIGSIPVVLSDRYEFPDLGREGIPAAAWHQAVIHHPEAGLEDLDARIRALSLDQRRAMQAEGQRLFAISRRITCFA